MFERSTKFDNWIPLIILPALKGGWREGLLRECIYEECGKSLSAELLLLVRLFKSVLILCEEPYYYPKYWLESSNEFD